MRIGLSNGFRHLLRMNTPISKAISVRMIPNMVRYELVVLSFFFLHNS